ncbi:transposase [Desulfonatronum parangueonense]
MRDNANGEVLWYEIKHHADNVELDAFVVMPNHIHGILIWTGNDNDIYNKNHKSNQSIESVVETRHALSLQGRSQPQSQSQPQFSPRPQIQSPAQPSSQCRGQNRFQNQGKNTLSSIVGSYKAAVTRHARRLGFDFAWQARFYDHIIRDADSYQKIQGYIRDNPVNWQADTLYVEQM